MNEWWKVWSYWKYRFYTVVNLMPKTFLNTQNNDACASKSEYQTIFIVYSSKRPQINVQISRETNNMTRPGPHASYLSPTNWRTSEIFVPLTWFRYTMEGWFILITVLLFWEEGRNYDDTQVACAEACLKSLEKLCITNLLTGQWTRVKKKKKKRNSINMGQREQHSKYKRKVATEWSLFDYWYRLELILCGTH